MAEDEDGPKVTKTQALREIVWLRNYAQGKPMINYGGNFWGTDRKRCMIIMPSMIAVLTRLKYIEFVSGKRLSFKINDEVKTK